MNLLLVDDEPLVLELLEERVANVLPGAKLNCFSKASDAMEYAKQNKIDIAFLDINMRVLDGVTMAKQLQQLDPTVNVIFCTGYSEYMEDALNLYCSAYLMKPVTEERIKDAIAHLRYPMGERKEKGTQKECDVYIQCIGGFEVFYKGEVVQFQRGRTKEMLALLVARNGAECSTAWLNGMLFGEEDHTAYIRKFRKDLVDTFQRLGAENVIRSEKGNLAVNREQVRCDYFDYLDGTCFGPIDDMILNALI